MGPRRPGRPIKKIHFHGLVQASHTIIAIGVLYLSIMNGAHLFRSPKALTLCAMAACVPMLIFSSMIAFDSYRRILFDESMIEESILFWKRTMRWTEVEKVARMKGGVFRDAVQGQVIAIDDGNKAIRINLGMEPKESILEIENIIQSLDIPGR